ncbi:hypothetical protein MTO96_016725 [Rhipicephalus appendiculatus]
MVSCIPVGIPADDKDYGHYKFGYDIVDGHGSINGRHETGSAYGPVHGSYYLGIIDGRHRQVHYVADKWGFRAMVKTNEHGTKTSLPAAAPYHSANGKHVPATTDTTDSATTSSTATGPSTVATKPVTPTAPCTVPTTWATSTAATDRCTTWPTSSGFRAVVKTNEPGTKTSLPAAAPYITAHGKSVPAYGHGGYGGYGGHGYGGYGYGGHGYGGYGYGGYGYGGHGYYG